MAKFLEYQGKEHFKKAGIPVPEGIVASTPEEVVEAARTICLPIAEAFQAK